MHASQNESTDERPARSLSAQACAVMLILFALYYARSLTVPVVTAVVMYLVLRPIVRQGRRVGIHSTVGAAAIIVGLLSILVMGTYLVIDPARQAIAEAPHHLETAKQKLSFISQKIREVDEVTEDLADTAKQSNSETPVEEKPVPVEIKRPTWTSNIAYISGTGNVVSFLTICGALLYFLLATGDSLLRNIMRALPSFTARRRLVEVIESVQEGVGTYLAQVSAINAGLGISVGLAMWILGMPSPVLWGAMAFAFNYLPIVGAIVGAAIIFLVAIVTFEPTYYAFVVTVTFLILTSLEGQFITPTILGRSMSISPVLVFLSIVFWGWMWGVMGIFLSIPILIAARMACEHYEGLLPVAMILGAEVSGDVAQAQLVTSSECAPNTAPTTSATPKPATTGREKTSDVCETV